jgi:hypothetical protein
MASLPRLSRDRKRRDQRVGPAVCIVTLAVSLLMVRAAERDCKLVADFASQCAGLGDRAQRTRTA